MSQAQYKKRLKALMNKPENQVCSDCPERQPRWASLIVPPPGAPSGSLPIGAFCCLECSGSHRRLGVHISFVRSINLDSWKEKEVLAMENGGNKKVNAIFEAKLTGSTAKKPTNVADGPTRERFIRDKYERRKYYDASVLQNYIPEQDEETPTTRRKATSSSAAARQPSEAARLRAQSRKAKNDATVETTTAARPKAPKAAPPPPAAAAEVDLLDFAAFDAPAPAPVPAAPTSPNLDLFANMTVSDTTAEAVPAASPVQPARKTNDDILAMFSTSTAHQPSTNMAVGMATPNGGSMMMSLPQQQQPQNPMMMMQPNTMMQGGGQVSNAAMMMPQQQQQTNNNMMQPNMMMMGNAMQQQQQQNTMFMQNQGNAMMMQQQGNNTFMVQKNNQGNVMMMQQGQPGDNSNMMRMMQQASNSDDFGFPQAPMGSGPPIAQNGGGQLYNAYTTQKQQQSAPTTPQQQHQQANTAGASPNDPFAQFGGQNVFR